VVDDRRWNPAAATAPGRMAVATCQTAVLRMEEHRRTVLSYFMILSTILLNDYRGLVEAKGGSWLDREVGVARSVY
jgi:hypothetical protein